MSWYEVNWMYEREFDRVASVTVWLLDSEDIMPCGGAANSGATNSSAANSSPAISSAAISSATNSSAAVIEKKLPIFD